MNYIEDRLASRAERQNNDFFSQQSDWSLLNIVDMPEVARLPHATYMDLSYSNSAESKSALDAYADTSPIHVFSPSNMTSSSNNMECHKRKCSSLELSADGNEEEEDGVETEEMKKFARQNHSEIEKRRRNKMNTYIMQLSKMLPMCNTMNRKCDKLTVLRIAVQYMKSLRGSASSTTTVHKPTFLCDEELKRVILQAADGFLFVVGCDRARILFVSESVSNILQYTRNDLIGQSLFDYIHPKDILKVKEQFSNSDLAPRERLIDVKTLMPVKSELPQHPTNLCSGARRSFYCRMKYCNDNMDCSKLSKFNKDELEYVHRKRKSDKKLYTVIHFTGYLKSWPTSKINMSSEEDNEESCNFLSCLVAVGQTLNKTPSSLLSSWSSCVSEPYQMVYMFRVSMDGKLTFIDQATTVVLGYLPQELVGTSVYEYYHQDELARMAEIHRKVLASKEKIQTGVYRFKGKNGSFLHVRSTCFSFRNPWTKDVEYIVSTNTIVPMEEVTSSCQGFDIAGVLSHDCSTEDSLLSGCERHDNWNVPGLPGDTKPGAGKIGRQIADEILENARHSKVVGSTNTDVNETQKVDCYTGTRQSATGTTMASSIHGSSGTSLPLSEPNGQGQDSVSLLDTVIEEQALENISNTMGTDESDEAAMSIIMSLLEADAGLGGPIDFNDLPWPL